MPGYGMLACSKAMMNDASPWDTRCVPHLHAHLQLAIELELWTIPFYAAALTSIEDTSSRTYALLRAIVRQEFMHVVALANIANAFGYSPEVRAPRYGGVTLPHLGFDLHVPNPISLFAPHATSLGALDHPRLNAMCLIEYPAWPSDHHEALRHDDLADYSSVREFYDSIAAGIAKLRDHIRGDRRQLADPRFAGLCISKPRADGYLQIVRLLDVVREQGEGARRGAGVPAHAPQDDDPEPDASHFAKLNDLRDGPLPKIWTGEFDPPEDSPGAAAQAGFAAIVERTFAGWELRFAGDTPAPEDDDEHDGSDDLSVDSIITAAAECWRAGAMPRLGLGTGGK